MDLGEKEHVMKSSVMKSSVMKVKRDKIVLIVSGISIKNVAMTQTPTRARKSFSILFIPKKGLLDILSPSWSIKVFSVAVAIVSPIY